MPDPLATLTDRLYADYQPGITHADIDRIVQQCRTDLADTPDTALPELWNASPGNASPPTATASDPPPLTMPITKPHTATRVGVIR